MAFSGIQKETLQELMTHQGNGCVSIFMPAQLGGAEVRQNPIRLKNLITQAERQLVDSGMRSSDARDRLDPVRAILMDSYFWQHQGRGLAVFVAEEEPVCFRVPLPLEELVSVSERFHIKPLLPLIHTDGEFQILAISENQVRLFRAAPFDIKLEGLPPGVPESMAEMMAVLETEDRLQFHTSTGESVAGGSRRRAVYHGQGEGTDQAWEKRRVQEFCHRVDGGVSKMLADRHWPLVLAATDPILSLYRQANHYDYLHDEEIRGNPDQLQPRQLHAEALQRLQGHFERRLHEDIDRYGTMYGAGRATDNLHQIVRASHQSQIDTLFVAIDEHVWGRFDDGQVVEHADRQSGDQDLLDLAAVKTWLSGGGVHAIVRESMPEKKLAVATLRFST